MVDWEAFEARHSATPVYKQLGMWIADQVAAGALTSGDQIPAERRLAELTGVSVDTVRAAMRVLREMDLIETGHGTGSFIKLVFCQCSALKCYYASMRRTKLPPLYAGQQFHEFTVIDPNRWIEGKTRRRRAALVRCSCSTSENVVERLVAWEGLRSGNNMSCGHYHRQQAAIHISAVNSKHGMFGHRLYGTWNNMVQRCHNPNNDRYEDWGGRGIEVHPSWRTDPRPFIEYIEKLPHCGDPGYSIDRIDNSRNYEPGNIKFSTIAEQNRNQRSNILTEDDVREIRRSRASGDSLKALAERFGTSPTYISMIANHQAWRDI